MDIATWLRELGLERYEEAFRENEIDAEILPKLTADDLKDIGITIVGHRRKLLEAIAALAEPTLAPQAEPNAPAEAPPTPRPPEAERRQLTVMFVDMVGSTELSGKLDPEDMRGVITGYQNACTGVITRFDGHIAKYMGDGVLAYFGYPRAHEDDAERAVRAGLELADAIGRQRVDGAPLAVRIGIATGQVVVGDLVGEGAAQEEAVVGETPNLAARLQNLAEPASVVIGPGTHRLVAGLFDLADLGRHALRGFAEPVQAWVVRGAGVAESRFAARSATGLTAFVGRQHELGLLLDRFEQARESEGQVVLLAGEPGIGKSRLVHALLERLDGQAHTLLRYYCSPYHTNSAFHPVIEQIERAAGIAMDDPPERRLDKLEALLGHGTSDPVAIAPLFAALLSLPAARYRVLDLPAQRQRERTIETMVDQIVGLAARSPVVLVLEDAHWLDPTTTELFEHVIERVQTLPALLLVTFRPEFAPPWTSYPHTSALTLNRLGRRHSSEMVAAVTGGKPLPDEVLTQIWIKTEGVPLFVEELTKTVLESGLLEDQGDRYALSGPLPPLAIPATLQDSLMARLDRLAPVKEVAQIGAVIGREFAYRLLAALAPLDEPALQDALSKLVGAELIFRRGTIPDATYSFKHVFVQDAAYQSLLNSKRQQLHARIARTLLERFPESAAALPEIVAHHFAQAGLVDEAVRHAEQAGELARSRSAMTEAAAHFASAIELLSALPDSTERKQRELSLRTAQGAALIAAKGLAATEVAQVYARARALCDEVGDEELLFAALCGQYWFQSQTGELDNTLATAEEVLRLAQRQEDTAPLVIAHRITGTSLFHLGRLIAAREHLEKAVVLYDPVRHSGLASLYAFDPRMAGLAFLSWLLWALGYPEQARRRGQEAIEHARELGHPHSMAHALSNACVLHQLCRSRQAVEKHAGDLIALASQQEFRFWLAIGTIMQGWVLAKGGQVEAGIEQMRRGLEDYRATGASLWSPCFLTPLAELYGRAGQAPQGLAVQAEALEGIRRTGGGWYEAEVHRQKGELLRSLPRNDPGQAERCYLEAIAVARHQDARMWELRAAISLARLWRGQGRRAKAHELLAPVYDWFTEGFDTQDLKDAKALLDELA